MIIGGYDNEKMYMCYAELTKYMFIILKKYMFIRYVKLMWHFLNEFNILVA